MKLFNLKLDQELSSNEDKTTFQSQEFFFSASSVALGIFDGVHLGHQSIIKAARQEALDKGLNSVILTFENLILITFEPLIQN